MSSNKTGFRQGRLGIGKEPIFPLDISGSMRIEGDLVLAGTIADIQGNPIEFGASSATFNMDKTFPDPTIEITEFPDWSNNVVVEGAGKFEDIASKNGDIYYNGGNVGIGTSTPQTKLEVSGTITSDNLNVGKDFSFSKETKITASDAAAGDNFGHVLEGVAIDGNYAIVGAPNNDDPNNSGSAYIFDVKTGTELHKLTASDPEDSDYFGRVAISGNYAIVSAYYSDDAGSNSGSAYIFDVLTGNQLHKITASDAAATDYFGCSVAISGNYAIVGANGKSSYVGAAYIFDVTSGSQVRKLTASDGATNSNFGQSVDIDGNYAIVGAEAADVDGTNSGRAYIFDVTTGTQLHMLSSNDIAEQDAFGCNVAISGNYAIVGAERDDSRKGSAYIFNVQTGAQLHKLVDTDRQANDDFGASVAISGNYAIVGARQYRNGVSPNRGAVFMYDVISGTEIKKITASDAADDDWFGNSLAISGNYVIVGAYNDDDNGSNSGSAYIYGPTGDSFLKITNDSQNMVVNGNVDVTGNLDVTGSISPLVGMVSFFAKTTAPTGWLSCSGQFISKTSYSNLYSVIGDTYGSNSTQFKLPDLRGNFIRCLNTTSSGTDTNRTLSQFQDFSTGPPQQTAFTAESGGAHTHSASTESAGNHNHSASSGNAGAHRHSQGYWYSYSGSAYGGWHDPRMWAGSFSVGSWGASTHTTSNANEGGKVVGHHSHSVSVSNGGSHSHTVNIGQVTGHNHNIGGGDSETRPKNYALLACIKY